MRLVKKKEFMKMSGFTGKRFMQYAKRDGVIFYDKDKKFVDLDLEPNNEFVKKWAPIKKAKPQEQNIEGEEPNKTYLPAPTEGELDVEEGDPRLYELNKIKKLQEIERLKKDNQLRDIEIARKSGQSIPMGDVKVIFAQTLKQYVSGFTQAGADIVALVSEQMGLPKDEQIDLQRNFEDMVNMEMEKAKSLAKQALIQLAEETSEARAPGQKK